MADLLRHHHGAVSCRVCGATVGRVDLVGHRVYRGPLGLRVSMRAAVDDIAHACPGRRSPHRILDLLPATVPDLADATGYTRRRVRQVLRVAGAVPGPGRRPVWGWP